MGELAQPVPTNRTGSAKVWQQRTPAMAAGLTDHIWSLQEVLMFRVPSWPQPQTVSDDDQGLIWTGEAPESVQHVQPETDSEMAYHEQLQPPLPVAEGESVATKRGQYA